MVFAFEDQNLIVGDARRVRARNAAFADNRLKRCSLAGGPVGLGLGLVLLTFPVFLHQVIADEAQRLSRADRHERTHEVRLVDVVDEGGHRTYLAGLRPVEKAEEH
jgi:hypothetical protein